MRVPERKLLPVIDTIHRAGVDPDAWQDAVDGIQTLFPATCVALHGYQGGDQPRSISVTSGWSPALARAYRAKWVRHNPYPALIPQMKIGAPVIADESDFIAGVRRTEFYNDFLLKHDLGSAVGIPLWNEPDRACFLAIDYSVRQAARLNKPTARAASLIAPHLARSFAVAHRLAGARPGSDELAALLDRIRGPALIIDRKRQVRSANTLGEMFLRTGRAVKLDRSGCVQLADSAAEVGFQRAMGACFNPSITVPPFTIPIRSGDGGKSSWLNVAPLQADTSLAKGPLAGFLADRERLALLIVARTWEPPQDIASRLRDAFKLTPAEAKLAAALMEGLSLESYARDRDVAINTVRNQLQSLFEKTRTHRQGELIAALFRDSRRAGRL
ncbi:MAG: helix-turn-helix transcriptional regulator [Hyphomonadaceae bacterium]|nr:helix-turn-helix transcriptional regulator [Hyphomonadaceae bacterium]